MNQPLADLIRRHLAAESAQDLEGTLATLHPDCRFDFATGQTWHGREGAAAHYRQWWTTFDVTDSPIYGRAFAPFVKPSPVSVVHATLASPIPEVEY